MFLGSGRKQENAEQTHMSFHTDNNLRPGLNSEAVREEHSHAIPNNQSNISNYSYIIWSDSYKIVKPVKCND